MQFTSGKLCYLNIPKMIELAALIPLSKMNLIFKLEKIRSSSATSRLFLGIPFFLKLLYRCFSDAQNQPIVKAEGLEISDIQ